MVRHDRQTREVEFNVRLHAFARTGVSVAGLRTISGATKGKDERGVGRQEDRDCPSYSDDARQPHRSAIDQ